MSKFIVIEVDNTMSITKTKRLQFGIFLHEFVKTIFHFKYLLRQKTLPNR